MLKTHRRPEKSPTAPPQPKAAAANHSLPAATQSQMGAAFGHDFSSVRIFADETAAESAQDMDAKAYTIGSDIFFNKSFYDPHGPDGQRLLAHELTHVVQQERHGPGGAQTRRDVSDPGDASEREAETVADQVTSGAKVQVHAAPSAVASRGLLDWVEHKASDAWHGTQHLASSAVHGVEHAASSAWHGAEHLASGAVHGAQHLASNVGHAATGAWNGVRHLGTRLAHGASGLAHRVGNSAGRVWNNASHFASNAVHGLGHIASRGLHGAENLVSSGWRGARSLGSRALHRAEHLASGAVHGVEHLASGAVHGAGRLWNNATQFGGKALHGAENLAERGLHGVEHLGLEALHGTERLGKKAWTGVQDAASSLPSLHDLGDAASEQFAPLLNAKNPWEALKAEGQIAYNGMKTAGGWVKGAGEGITHGIDWLEDKEKAGSHWLAGQAKGIPGLEQLANAGAGLVDMQTELTGGVLKGATGLVEGVAGMVVNPVDTLKGLEAMGEHIPMMGGLMPNPLKAAHGLLNVATGDETWGQLGKSLDPRQSLQEDGKFWKGVGGGLIDQYSDSWKKGKYGDVIGHAGFDIASMFLTGGAGEAGKVGEAAKLGEMASVASKAGEAGKLGEAAKIGDAARLGDAADAARASDAAKAGDAARVSAHPGVVHDSALTGALPEAQRGKGVAVFSSPEVEGSGVRVVTHGPDGKPLQTLEVHAGPEATAAHVAEHVKTVEDLQKYQGLGGRVRGAADRVKEAVGMEGVTPPKGTRAFEAQHEVSKLDGIIARRQEQLRAMEEGGQEATEAQRLRAEIDDLSAQRAEHAQTLADRDLSPGRGYVEAKGPKRTETIAKQQGLPDFQKQNPGYSLREKNGRVEVVAPKGGEKRVLDPLTKELRPQFRNGAEAAKTHGLPEAEEGYHWVLNGEDQPVYKRRSTLPDEDGLVPPERRFNPETKDFQDVGGIDARARYKTGPADTMPVPKEKARADQYEKVMANRSKAVAERDKLLDRLDQIDSKTTLSPQEALERQKVEQELSHAHGRVNEQSRQLGEMGTEDYMKSRYPNAERVYGGPDAASHAGDFDQVWRNPPAPGVAGPGEEIMISAEAKGGSAGLGSRKVRHGGGSSAGKRVEQGTPEYFKDIAAEMGKKDILETGGPHAGENLGDNLTAAARSGNAKYMHIKVPIKKGAGGSAGLGNIEAREFDMSPRGDIPRP